MESIVEIRDLKKYYGDRLVLNIPKLTIYAGQRCALIGANGSGKTTLLRIITGILPPDEGEVIINTDKLSYMPQKPYAFVYSVQKNVEMAIREHNGKKEKALRALEKVGLAHMSENRGSSLSGGETQRMAFARILAQENDLVLLDEPTAAADIAAEEMLEAALKEHLVNTSASLIFTTHTPSQAASLAQRVILLDEGCIAEDGEAEQVLRHPATDIAKRFLSHWRL